ncbi:Rv3235 family protein [Nocardia cyriacigeorgica]|uniref:Rv3235 family protein n=1 Tax=Nocardia cyriacigeorgica TaxID=135487 RepID=UPI001E5ACB82|nr:Rv3235 family protein [Nocardia cyriacigeorgica]
MAQGQERETVSTPGAVTLLGGAGARRRGLGDLRAAGCGTRRVGPPRSRRPIPATPPPDRTPATAQRFADHVVRATLEILDRRRPITQLDAVASPDVVARIHTLAAGDLAPGRQLGPAVPMRVTVSMDEGPDAEVCARYRRGPRLLALAARITYTRRHGWRLTALRIG